MERDEVIYLDTHVVLWVLDAENERLSIPARQHIEKGDLMVSPAVLLELELLYEIGRLKAGALQIVARAKDAIGIKVCDLPFPTVVENALAEKWVRDPFDRLIVAQARVHHAPLVTKDEAIRRHYRPAVW
jgi:PIN domain nuclease of toxin-antitoxin system